jgi:dehydrodolichyl diphosphate syntase complex subunit NUS1
MNLHIFIRRQQSRPSIKDDFHSLEMMSGQWLSKIPRHMALAILETSISMQDVARLVMWSMACGCSHISLYDVRGHFKSRQLDLLNHLTKLMSALPSTENAFQLHWNDNSGEGQLPNGNGRDHVASKNVYISLLSQEDGRPDIVRAARHLARQVANGDRTVDELDENVLGEALAANHGLPDPEVLVRFGLAHSNLGFPPWQIRQSEIHDIDTHHGVRRQDFFQVLLKYSKCEQRFGQ